MARHLRRSNPQLRSWLKASGVATVTYGGLLAMDFAPGWGAAALALIAAVMCLAAMDIGILVAVIALSLPLMNASPVVGIGVLVLGVIMVRYLGADGGGVFFVASASLAGAFFGPAWAGALMAGYVMGAGEGAVAAALACVLVQSAGLLTGKPELGATVTGGSPESALLHFTSTSYFAAAWLKAAFGAIDTEAVNTVVGAISSIKQPALAVSQPIVWAAGAGLTGAMARNGRQKGKPVMGYLGILAGIVVLAAGTMIFGSAFGGDIPSATIGVAAITSLIIAGTFAVIWEKAFPLELVHVSSGPSSMSADDADVDELLRLIATAEEKLSTEHTSFQTVMITDMKSFSKMTEEDGSFLTAKNIQRHRDLLLPIIDKHGGHGKSTGGDGLVAAFNDPAAALRAACEMQRVMADQNTNHPDQREMTVRIGVADGEVVLDRGGRPFIGAGLNLAARVMNLADGGQSFVTAAVYEKGKNAVPGHPHGDFELKNIAQPISVYELMWYEGQQPVDPRGREIA